MSAHPDIRQLTLKGLGWSGISTFLQRAGQFGFTIVLARLIAPFDWGLFAIMGVFTGFASLFVDFGFSYAIIQRPELEDRHINSAFWLNLSIGAGLTLVVMGLAPALVAFYSEPRLLSLTIVFAPAFLIGSLTGIQGALLRRAMDFRKVAIIENITFFGSNVVAVVMALLGLGVWSFVGLTIAHGAIKSVLLWSTSSWRPRAFPDRRSIRELWGFSANLTAFNALSYWGSNADNLLIGRFIGVTPLAFYSRAYNLMLVPIDGVNLITTAVMYPALSRIQHDRERVKRIYLRAVGLISMATFPAIVGLFVLSRPFIDTLYGEKWDHAVPYLRILCVASLVQVLTRTTEWIFSSQGRSDWLFRWGLVSSTTVIASFAIGLPWGVRGISIAYSSWAVLTMFPLFAIVSKLIDLPVLHVVRAVRGVTCAASFMGVCTWFVAQHLFVSSPQEAQLGIGFVVGVLSYAAALRVLRPPPYREFIDLLHEFIRKRRDGRATPVGDAG